MGGERREVRGGRWRRDRSEKRDEDRDEDREEGRGEERRDEIDGATAGCKTINQNRDCG